MLHEIDTYNFEINLLGCAVANYTLDAQEALSPITADMLNYNESKIMLAAINRCLKNGQAVSIPTVWEAIEVLGLVSKDFNLARLTEIITKEAISSANLKAYSERIRQLNALRGVLGAIREAEQAILSTRDTGAALEAVTGILGKIEISSGNEPKRLDAVIKDYLDHQMAVYRGEAAQGQRLSMDGLSHAFGSIGETDLVVVAGRPAMGKSQTALAVASELSLEKGKPVLFISLEMDDTQIGERVLLSRSNLSIDDVESGRAFENDNEVARMGNSITEIQDKPFFINQEGGATLEQITIQVKKFAKKNPNTGAIIIDYLGLIKSNGNLRHDLAIAEITGGLKRLAQEVKTPIILLAQLNRSLEQRQNKRPVMSDLRDSGAIEQDADKIVFVYRDAVYDPQTPLKSTLELINAKRRRGKPQNGYCHFKGGNIQPMTDSEQVWAQDLAESAHSAANNKQDSKSY